VNAGRPRIVRTSAKEDAIIAAVERAPWRSSRDIVLELELSQLRVLELLHYYQTAIPLHAEGISFPRRSFSNADVRECLRLSPKEDNILYTTFCGQMKRAVGQTILSAFTSHLWAGDNHNAICEWGIDIGFRVKVWVGMMRVNAVGPLPATRAADCSTILRFSGKWYTGAASSSSSCEVDVVSVSRRTSALWGRCPEMP